MIFEAAKKIELSVAGSVARKSGSGSVYISLPGKVKQIRIANHPGHKQKRNHWELRSDAMTKRGKDGRRIYNIRDIDRMIEEIK